MAKLSNTVRILLATAGGIILGGLGYIALAPKSLSDTDKAYIRQLASDIVEVEGGTFTMGASATDAATNIAEDDEKPAHNVTISTFCIGRHEVTQAQWEAVMGNNPAEFKSNNAPVENVSWDDCQEFIERLNEYTGKQFRLPTEAEWEYAARGGKKSRSTKYSGSNDSTKVAWFKSNAEGKTHDIGTKAPNELGLYDMSGNVLEWCQDWYDDNYYANSPEKDPQGPESGRKRVCRGGRWNDGAVHLRLSYREWELPSERINYLGLRLACDK